MKLRVLMIASVPSMIGQFNMDNIHILQELGYEVDVACDFTDRSVWTEERIARFKIQLESMNVAYYQIDFSRSVLYFNRHRKSYYQVKKLCIERKYKFIHCHTPIASAITRLVCNALNMKVIYTAHGFHFYKGAPLKNWILFYPIERWLSRYTDILITINNEDYQRAKKTFKMRQLEYIPGVGIDFKRYQLDDFDYKTYRMSLGVSDKDIMILSVGEVNENKNHIVIINAIKKLNISNIKYFIVGKGSLMNNLKDLICELGLEKQVFLLGYRDDIPELDTCADIFAFPSKREGLGLAAIEAMYCSTPLITSNVHGINDYMENGVNGYSCASNDIDSFTNNIYRLYCNRSLRMNIAKLNNKKAKKFSQEVVIVKMKDIYQKIW